MKLFQQVSFWIVTSVILVLVFGQPYKGYINSFYFVTFLLPVIVGTSYVFNGYLVPRFLYQKRYFKFWLYTLYTVIVSLNLEMMVIVSAFAILANYHFAQMIPATTNVFGLAFTMYFIVLLKAFRLVLKNSFSAEEKARFLQLKQENMEKGYVLIKSDRMDVKVLFDDILYIESLGDFVRIVTRNKPPLITREKIGLIEQKLPLLFIRIHRSFIIHKDKVGAFNSQYVEIAGQSLPISRKYKTLVRSSLTRKIQQNIPSSGLPNVK